MLLLVTLLTVGFGFLFGLMVFLIVQSVRTERFNREWVAAQIRYQNETKWRRNFKSSVRVIVRSAGMALGGN